MITQRRRSIDQLRQAHREPFAREHGAHGFGLQRDAAQGEDSNAEQLRGNDAGHPPSLRFGAASLGSRDSHISYIKIYWIQIQRPPAFKPGTMIRLPDMITNGAEIRHESAFEPLDNAQLRKVKSGSSMILNVLRHSTAMNMLQHGVDRSVIAMWLGHESMDTTQIYLHADIELKEKVLAKTEPFRVRSGRYRPSDQLLAFLQAL